MNTREQAIDLAKKATGLLDRKKGVFELTFFDNTTTEVRVLNINSKLDHTGFSCTLTTFTNDVKLTTRHDIYEIQDIK